MKRMLFAVLLVFCCLNFAFAAPFSDLNTKGFHERVTPQQQTSGENPFLKQNVSPQDMLVEDLHLTGIVYRTGEAYALISGFIIKEGDAIAGYKVKVVERDHVILRQLDEVKVLRLE